MVKQKMADGARNARVRLYDFTAALQAGENLVAISTDSHTEKQMSEIEARQFPASQHHLNQNPGVAFYLRARAGEKFTEVISDGSWVVRRAPEAPASSPKTDDTAWSKVVLLPVDRPPIDEGPGLEPLRRRLPACTAQH